MEEILEGARKVFEQLGYSTADTANALGNLSHALATTLSGRSGRDSPSASSWGEARVVVSLRIEPKAVSMSDVDRYNALSKIRWKNYIARGESIHEAARGDVSATEPVLAQPGAVKAVAILSREPADVPDWKTKQIVDQLGGAFFR